MILTGPEIHKRVQSGHIQITPFRENQINPASYDLRLGKKAARYLSSLFDFQKTCISTEQQLVRQILDSKREPEIQTIEFDVNRGLLLEPQTLYLMHTEEIVVAHNTVPIVDGKSSIGRLGISVHQTAGYGDPGFNGQYTLEVTVVHPVIVYAGMRFCQIRFHEVVGEIRKYDGNYQGESSRGPVPSKSWKQFEKDGR